MLWLLCDIWFVCFGIVDSFCIIKQYLCGSKNPGAMTTPVHTNSVCRLRVRQADRRRDLRAWECQMFPCWHRGEMFAILGLCLPGSPQSHRLAAWCPKPVSAGERGTHIYRGDEGQTSNVLCVTRGKRNTSHTSLSSGERSILFLCWCKGDSFGLAGGQTECQSCHGGGWPYQTSIDAGCRRICFYRTHTHSRVWNLHVGICFWLVWLHFSVQQTKPTSQE